ncbi:MAG: hypothetical protein RIR48_1592 [Bacteroidota bacterium]
MVLETAHLQIKKFVTLQNRCVSKLNKEDTLLGFEGLILFGQREHAKAFNGLLQERTISQQKDPIVYVMESIDTRPYAKENLLTYSEMADLKKKDADHTGGLEGILKLTVGDIVSIRKNINYRLGLVTNARGRVAGFGLRGDEVVVVFVKMFKLISTDTNYLDIVKSSNIVPIMRYKVEFAYRTTSNYRSDKMILRYQFPLSLNYANTVHSVQSLTHEGQVLLDIKSGSFNSRIVYTAVTRCKSLKNLFMLRDFQYKDISKKPTEDMIKEDERLFNNYMQTIIKYAKLVPDAFPY